MKKAKLVHREIISTTAVIHMRAASDYNQLGALEKLVDKFQRCFGGKMKGIN